MPLDGGVEDALDAAQVLADLLDLLGDVEEEVHVLFLVAAEVMHAHVPHLPWRDTRPLRCWSFDGDQGMS